MVQQKISAFIVVLLFSLPVFVAAHACHPKVNDALPQYIVGYGSLIDEQSKKRTDSTAQEGYPVLVKGYQRGWSVHSLSPGFGATFLSITENQQASFNGVIYRLSDAQNIQRYDTRERSYCRKELSSSQLRVYSTVLPKKKQVWIYTSIEAKEQFPSANYPIIQSYVDIFIRGCIQIEEKYAMKHFARDCIQNTNGWSNHWINDRIFPRRPTSYEPYALKIDTLLKSVLPEQFSQITIE